MERPEIRPRFPARHLGRALALGAAMAALSPAQAQDGGFRAGAATSNITPALGGSINGGMSDVRSRHVHDELLARCLVLEDGGDRLAIVACDSCAIPREVVLAAKAAIAERTGIPAERVLISATHAHSAATSVAVFQSEPEPAYRDFLAGRIADGVVRAANNLAPAQVGWGSGSVPEHVFNRRWHMKPGTIPPDPFGRTTDRVQMNPPVGSPNLVEPAGPTDPEVAVLSVRAPDGRPIAVLANYSLHYVGGVGAGHLSADYFGAFADRLQELLGADRLEPPFVGIMTNGTSGDINNIDFRTPAQPRQPYERIREVADAVAREVARVVGTIEHRDRARLDGRAETIRLGVRKPKSEEVEAARGRLSGSGGGPLRDRDEIYARETVLLAEYPDEVEATLQALRVGDLGIAAIPCEVFVEIGLDIKARSPLRPTFTIELANGYNGYLPTVAQHALGGYETWRARSSYLEVEAAPRIAETVLRLLGAVGGEP